MAGGEARNQMMQNLFGDQSEDEEEEEVISDHRPTVEGDGGFNSDEGEGEADVDGEGEVEAEGEGEVEDQGEVEVESDVDHAADADQGESDGERAQSSPEQEVSAQRVESEGKDAESEEEEEEGYGQRAHGSRRREVVASESDESETDVYADHEDDSHEVDNRRRKSSGQKDNEIVRDVFGDSDEDDSAEYGAQNKLEQEAHISPGDEEEVSEKDLRPEDVVPDEDDQYESEEEHIKQNGKEKPVGPPLEMEIPLRPPPSEPKRMNLIRVSNIMGIEPKPFDPKTYVEKDVFVTDESGSKKQIRLEDNIVRWRTVKNRDGTVSYESNARFVRWSDGSLQLLIGNEVLDIAVNEDHHEENQLFLRHGKGILQSQGKLQQKMRFMPSSLSSRSHRLLTALVDSRHKKVHKVKNCVTNFDPEREKEEKEKAEGQNIRAIELLNRRREKVNRKYAPPLERGRQLTPGFLEDALDEDEDNEDYYSSRHGSGRRSFEEDLEVEARAEKRIMNAKKSQLRKEIPRKPSIPAARSSRRPVEEFPDSEREESEYETDGEDIETSPPRKQEEEPDYEDEYEEEEEEAEENSVGANTASEDEEAPKSKKKDYGKRKEVDSDENSPPRKNVHRRKAIVYDSDEE